MPLWGTSTSNESKPKWLTDAQKEKCYATTSGWTYKHNNGTEEVLVAIRNLAGRLSASSVTEIKFGTGRYAAGGSKTLKISFNEPVAVTGNPTVTITGSVDGPVTATYASINSTGTTLTFNFTDPAAGNVLSVAAQTITLAGGTIKEIATGTADADLVITSGVASTVGTKTVVAASAIASGAFSTGTYTAGTTKSVVLTVDQPVAVTGNPTLVVTGSVDGPVTATYASINAAGTQLTFNFTVPAAGNVLSVAAQTVSLAGGTINETASGNAPANRAISSDISTAIGTKTSV